MIVIANDYANRAVWNALKIHIEFIRELGEEISLLIPKAFEEEALKEHLPYTIIPYSSTLEEIKLLLTLKDDTIFAPDILGVLYSSFAKLKGKKVLYWMQGSTPEESYMKHKSKLKYHILNFLEKRALHLSDAYIFVSSYMKEFIQKKYKQTFEPSIIVPCTSDLIMQNIQKEKDSFVYVGGMSIWQRVDRMLMVFNEIKKHNKNAKLYIATLDTKKAKDFIMKYLDKPFYSSVILTKIDDRKEMEEFLSSKEFGFLMRDDDIVNFVSSPIKLAEYLSCGVNVLISPSIKSYAPLIKKYEAGMVIENEHFKYQKLTAKPEAALRLYRDVFAKEKHLQSYKKLLGLVYEKV